MAPYVKKSDRISEAEQIKYTEPKIKYSKGNNDKHDIVDYLENGLKYERQEKHNLQKKNELLEIEIKQLRDVLNKNEAHPHQIWVDMINKVTPMVLPILKARFNVGIGDVPQSTLTDDDSRVRVVNACNKWQNSDDNFLRNLENVATFCELQNDLFNEMAENLNKQING